MAHDYADKGAPAATTDELDAAERLRLVQGEMAKLTQAVTALEQMTPEARELALGYLNRRYGRKS